MKTKMFYGLLLVSFLAMGTSCEKKSMNPEPKKKSHCNKHQSPDSPDSGENEVQS